MHEESLRCHRKRRFVPTTASGHTWRTDPNLVNGTTFDAPDQAWVAERTAIRLPTTFVDLAALRAAYWRRAVGWARARWIDTDLTRAALTLALATRQPALGLIQHSDQGVRDANRSSVERRAGIGARISMAARGNPYEKAQAERFFKTLTHAAV
jgi:putative transposase